MRNIAQELTEAIKVVCPIDGVAIVDQNDKSTWRIDYQEIATPAERAAATDVLLNFV